MYAIFKKILKEPWRDISSVSKEPAVQLFGEYILDFRIPVIHIGTDKTEVDDFSPVIAGEMQLESVTPSHRSLPIRSHALENLVGIVPEVMTDRNHYAVYEADTRIVTEGIELKENISLKNTRLSSSTNVL